LYDDRDGVSDGQFNEVLDNELPALHGALERLGVPRENVRIAILVCQKRHHTRFVYEEPNGSESFTERSKCLNDVVDTMLFVMVCVASAPTRINPCPGVVVDARSVDSIVSSVYNEFYLNSHAPIQGTSKPCKYALLYDEVGFKISELELLTYWTTYLYARCNKSVSYATPAYYAHWASKRCKDLFASGATDNTLRDITARWANARNNSTMFFI
jgi:eukaryotic translation initiation factor 2C